MKTNLPDLPTGDILIVDDTPQNLRLLSTILTEQGYAVRKALNGEMALKSAFAAPPDLILLDIKMPDMNGYEVCDQLKADSRTQAIPIIFISALDDVLDKVRAFTIGGVDYITKPFQCEEVLARVRCQLIIVQFRQELEKQVEKRTAELKHTLLELQKAQVQLVQHEKMATLGQLVAGIAHEINNPVGFIAGNLNYAQTYIQHIIHHLQLYQQQLPQASPEIKSHSESIDLEFVLQDLPKMISSMKLGTDRIRQISVSLRNFSRADQDSRVEVDIHDGIDSTLMILQHRLKADNKRSAIEIFKEYGDLPLVSCYSGQLNQVFMNIIANAIDAFDEASLNPSLEQANRTNSITIKTEVLADTDQVLIKIKDNGLGMSPEVKNRVFDYLFTTKPTGKGTGLGLSISHQIVVEKHGGQIECNSVLGQGTEFAIRIPIE